MKSFSLVLFLTMVALLAGCDGKFIASANLLLATVPCGLLLATINIKKDR